MAKQITITNLNGSEPYQVYLCNGTYGDCFYYATINNSDIPYNILVPLSYNPLSTYGVIVYDSVGCEIKTTISI